MKRAFMKKTLIVLMGITILAGCKDVFDDKDIKNNPNSPSDAPYDVLLSAAETGLMTLMEDTDVRISMIWAGQLTGTSRQHLTFAKYQVSSAIWGWDVYWNTIANARLIQEKTKPFNNRMPLGIAQVIEAMVMAKLTALWGDVPYSQALDEAQFPHAEYDTQAEVYAALQSLLSEAAANLESGVGDFGASVDFIGSNGSGTPAPEKWAAAAHTLKARLFLHTGDYESARDEALLGISSIDGDLLSPHGESYGVDLNWNNSFFTINRPGDTGFSYSETGNHTFLPTLMESRFDNGKTDETALYNHFFQEELIVAGSLDPNTDDGMFKADAPHPVLTFYENQLILAEAYARLGDDDLAIDALNSVRQELAGGYIAGQVILQKYQDMGIRYDDYDVLDFDTEDDLILEILTTKYIVMLGQYESFVDVRRAAKATPAVTLGIPTYPGAGATGLPERYLYPQNEINTNPNTPNPVPGINVPLTYF
jgi:hypothetical protein